MHDLRCFCHDINGLWASLSEKLLVIEWWRFIDPSPPNLKAVLLHNGNFKPSIPITHSMDVHMESLFNAVPQWNIFGDLKIIAVLMDMRRNLSSVTVFNACGTVVF